MNTSRRAGSAVPIFKIGLWLAAVLLLVAGSLISLRSARAAATINVTSTVDSSDGSLYACPATNSKPCTLRLAIAAANNDSGDSVAIPAGTYTLTTHTELQIRTAMTIVGADPRTTIIDGDAANEADNHIFVVLSNPIDVGMSNLTVQHAFCSCGGSALVDESTGTLTLNNDAFLNNTTQDSSPTFGGAIYNGTEGSTHMVITRSLIANNQAKHGTDTGTASLSKGGGIYNQGGSTLSVTNTTMTGNAADSGGAIFNTGLVTLVNDTIAANDAIQIPNGGGPGGGGLVDSNPTSISLTNTIVSGNTNNDCLKFSGSGTFTSGGNNIDSDGTCFLTGTGDKPSTNPKLAALAANAPGQTSTMAIDNTSPAYNAAGAASCPATDQRGVTRPQGAACDIGAYELIVLPPSPSPTPALPKAGEAGASGPGAGWILLAIALMLAPLAVRMARPRYPDDIPAR